MGTRYGRTLSALIIVTALSVQILAANLTTSSSSLDGPIVTIERDEVPPREQDDHSTTIRLAATGRPTVIEFSFSSNTTENNGSRPVTSISRYAILVVFLPIVFLHRCFLV